MAKINQIIAIEKGIKSETYSALTKIHKQVQKPDLFNGFVKTYVKLNDDGEELPAETKRVQLTAATAVAHAATIMKELFDIEARKEWSNANATADICVDDNLPIVQNVPVTYLLFLEKQLTDLRTLIGSMPTLDANDEWAHDVTTGLFKTEATKTHRTKKIQRPIVLYDATDNHPAQTEMITEDVLAGHWTTVKHSGAVTVPDGAAMIGRVDTLLRAVKQAREAANSTEESSIPNVSGALLDYLFTST